MTIVPIDHLSTAEILAARPPKNAVDPWRPYHYLVEQERSAAGVVEDVATIFLTNRECPFRCTMCDLWRNTLDEPTPLGAIPAQIEYALSRLPPAQSIKLYNSGNFFDAKAIPPADHDAIADRVRRFSTVIVENHPRLCGDECVGFRDRLTGELEIALGLETAHPDVLAGLNKQMTVEDFRRAAEFLVDRQIAVRTFILLKPPFLDEDEAVAWAIRSLEVAFASGARVCSLIPTRGGNGAMEQLAAGGFFSPPKLSSLERAMEAGLAMGKGRVFVDLWDIAKLARCPECRAARAERLARMNLTQTNLPPVDCVCNETAQTQTANDS
jgi:radical SAM enzyme (TIGR01210 family)